MGYSECLGGYGVSFLRVNIEKGCAKEGANTVEAVDVVS